MRDLRRPLVLAAILVAFGLYYLWTANAGAPGTGLRVAASGSLAATRKDADREVEELAVAQLERKPGVYKQGRDLFRYAAAPDPVLPPPAPRPSPLVEPPDQAPVVEEAPRREPPAIDVAYLGSFGRPGRRIAVFSDEENVYNALVGDTIKEKFVLVAIGYESVDLRFIGFPDAAPRRLAAGGLR